MCVRTCVYTPKAKLEVSQASGPGNSTWPVPGEPLDGSRCWLSPACSCQCWPHSQNSKMLVLTESQRKSPCDDSSEEERKERGKSFSGNGFRPATHWPHSYTQSRWTFWSSHLLPSASLQAPRQMPIRLGGSSFETKVQRECFERVSNKYSLEHKRP